MKTTPLTSLLLFVLLGRVCDGADVKCSLIKNKSGADFDLSQAALKGITYSGANQNENKFWVLDCICTDKVITNY